jgi:hypothetical protein
MNRRPPNYKYNGGNFWQIGGVPNTGLGPGRGQIVGEFVGEFTLVRRVPSRGSLHQPTSRVPPPTHLHQLVPVGPSTRAPVGAHTRRRLLARAPGSRSPAGRPAVLSFSGISIIFPRRDVSLTALTGDFPLTVDRQKYVIRKLLPSSLWRARQTVIH